LLTSLDTSLRTLSDDERATLLADLQRTLTQAGSDRSRARPLESVPHGA